MWREIGIGVLFLTVAAPPSGAMAQALRAEAVNEAKAADKPASRARIAKLQILLDRARFSPGVIDGRMGENVVNAVAAFREVNGLDGKSKTADEETWERLGGGTGEPVLVEYTIAEQDVKGPFTKDIPEGLEAKKDLDRLAYTGPVELLAEKFHMDEDFLKEINPGKDFDKAGTVIMVVNLARPEGKPTSVKRIALDKDKKQLRAYGDDDKLVAVYPASIGSKARPAPTGTHRVQGIAGNPRYTYNPLYKFEGVKSEKPFTVAPGPNNPVGSMWIDLSEEGYGIHGTPEPAEIGKTASHGCVRLTNWDVEALARMVKPGVPVEFPGA